MFDTQFGSSFGSCLKPDDAASDRPNLLNLELDARHRFEPSWNRALPEQHSETLMQRMLRQLYGLVVIASLLTIAYFGFKTEWTFGFHRKDHPRPTTIAPTVSTQPSEVCRHGLSVCPLCDPSAAQLSKAYRFSDDEVAAIQQGLASKDQSPPSIDRPIKDSGALLSGVRSLPKMTFDFQSAEETAKVGIDVEVAWHQAVVAGPIVSAEITLDPVAKGAVSTPVSGRVSWVKRQIGDKIAPGDLLVVLDSAEVGKAKSALLLAAASVKAKSALLARAQQVQLTPEDRRVKEAFFALEEARSKLLSTIQTLDNLGIRIDLPKLESTTSEQLLTLIERADLPDEVIARNQETALANLLVIKAPRPGVLTSLDVVAGENVLANQTLGTIIDPQAQELTIQTPATMASQLKIGQQVVFRPEGTSTDFPATVHWLAARADDVTRTIAARCRFKQSPIPHRIGQMGRAQIVTRTSKKGIVIPSTSIARVNGIPVVFVRDQKLSGKPEGAIRFHLRPVVTGTNIQDKTEIILGLAPGEAVVSRGHEFLANEATRTLLETTTPSKEGH